MIVYSQFEKKFENVKRVIEISTSNYKCPVTCGCVIHFETLNSIFTWRGIKDEYELKNGKEYEYKYSCVTI